MIKHRLTPDPSSPSSPSHHIASSTNNHNSSYRDNSGNHGHLGSDHDNLTATCQTAIPMPPASSSSSPSDPVSDPPVLTPITITTNKSNENKPKQSSINQASDPDRVSTIKLYDESNRLYTHNRHHPSVSNSYSLRKLLSSHSSIYNALTNPELDVSPLVGRDFTTPRLTPELMIDPTFSITSWQSIDTSKFPSPKILSDDENQIIKTTTNNSNIGAVTTGTNNNKRPLTSSILSVTTTNDDNNTQNNQNIDSTVIIPSPKSTNVMVFETDEEDYGVGNHDLGSEDNENDGFIHNPDSFIMPKISLSENSPNNKETPNKFKSKDKQFLQIVILSCQDSYTHEAQHLVKNIENDLNSILIKIHHIMINKYSSISTMKFDRTIVKNSDLIFIINDGSAKFLEYLIEIFGNSLKNIDDNDDENEGIIPKLTIVNMITVNYFINLFELINYSKPYQIWKASSLKQKNVVNKFKNFIKLESDNSNNELSLKDRNLTLTKFKVSKSLDRSRTMYSSLISKKKPDYKFIEKQFKSDLEGSTSFTDPLQITTNFSHLSIFHAIVKKLFDPYNIKSTQILEVTSPSSPSSPKPSKFWLICSFSIGIGFGIGIASGAASLFGFYIYDGLLRSYTEMPQVLNHEPLQQKISPFTIMDSMIDYYTSDFSDSINHFYTTLSNSDIFNEAIELSQNYTYYLRCYSSLVIDYFQGGLEKLVGLIIYSNH